MKTLVEDGWSSHARNIVGLSLGAVIYSAGLGLFLVPNNVIDGGVTGISLLLQAVTGIHFSILVVLLNIPFFYLGYKRLGARTALYSGYSILVFSIASHMLEKLPPATTDPFLSTIFGGIIMGIGIGLVIKFGGSTDGIEIVAILLDRKT